MNNYTEDTTSQLHSCSLIHNYDYIISQKATYANSDFNFKIIVTSEAGTSKTYTINIVRPNNNTNNNTNNNDNSQVPSSETNKKSSNNYLSSITLSNGNIDFNKEILEYNVSVLYDIDNIEVTAVPEDNKSKVEISGNNNLEVGNNKITILVISEDNNTREYIINVERKDKDIELSNNTNISNIIIEDYNIDFNKNKLDYTLKIKYEDKLNINVILEDNTSTYIIAGNDNLKNNSIISITVTSEDNTTRTYTINIKNNDKLIKIVFIIIITILIIINILRLILRKKVYQ